MVGVTSTTRWCDEPISPEGYEDVATLVRMARKARGRIVEFDWAFTPDDLRRLRRAVFEWGSEVVGRYKCFDARVLAAINGALGETDSPFVLNEPQNKQETDCKVSCVVDGDFCRLQGHAPFDIVFGYGGAGVEEDPTGSISPTARDTLANAVGMLGWDLLRLQENRYQPVVHALYGLPLGYGILGQSRLPHQRSTSMSASAGRFPPWVMGYTAVCSPMRSPGALAYISGRSMWAAKSGLGM